MLYMNFRYKGQSRKDYCDITKLADNTGFLWSEEFGYISFTIFSSISQFWLLKVRKGYNKTTDKAVRYHLLCKHYSYCILTRSGIQSHYTYECVFAFHLTQQLYKIIPKD